MVLERLFVCPHPKRDGLSHRRKYLIGEHPGKDMIGKDMNLAKSVKQFYDQQWKSQRRDPFALAFEEALQHSYTYLGPLQGKKLLEIGCGSGEQAVYFAVQGAHTTVIDISPESLQAIQQRARTQRVSVTAYQMNAEQVAFPDNEFDSIYINSTLMHVHHQKVLQECSRMLRKGGILVMVEPLQYAPFVQMYRLFSTYRRMKPQYATLATFKESKKYFSEFHHQEFYLFSSLLLPVFYSKNLFFHQIYHHLARFDLKLTRALPFLRYGCWVSVVRYRK